MNTKTYSKSYTAADGTEFKVIAEGGAYDYIVKVEDLDVASVKVVRTTARAQFYGVTFADGTTLAGEFGSVAKAAKAAMDAK